jgi:hypothetical protein
VPLQLNWRPGEYRVSDPYTDFGGFVLHQWSDSRHCTKVSSRGLGGQLTIRIGIGSSSETFKLCTLRSKPSRSI